MRAKEMDVKRNFFRYRFVLLLVLAVIGPVSIVHAQTTTFTYQGRIIDSGTAANGIYDLQFKLFDSSSVGSGNQIGATMTNATVTVASGVFTVQLDFGGPGFSGADRFLEIGVRLSGDPSPYTLLSPRQQLTSTPYAIRAGSASIADTAINTTQLGGVAANQYVQANDSRLSDSRSPAPGSSNYIQNSANQQAGSNFNISGDGTAGGTITGNAVTTNTQFNLGPFRFVSATGNTNTFVGINTGTANTTGSNNAFFGTFAGNKNTTGGFNSFFGAGAGGSNNTGHHNAFFGTSAGQINSSGDSNSFFGASAGVFNTTGHANSFFGNSAGESNNTGVQNSFFGVDAGYANTSGQNNSFFGMLAGYANISGSLNSFFGDSAGTNNTAGGNSFFGARAGQSNTNASFNSFFGYEAGQLNTGGFNSFFGSTAGLNTTGNANSFFGQSAGENNTSGNGNSFFGTQAGFNNKVGANNAFFGNGAGFSSNGDDNTFFGAVSGENNTTGKLNTFMGKFAGLSNTAEDNNTFIGTRTNGAVGITNATSIGSNAAVTQSNSLVLGSISGINFATADTNVGIGTTAPTARLQIAVNGGNLFMGDSGCGAGFAGIGFGSSLSCGSYSLVGNGGHTYINRAAGGGIFFRENNVTQVSIATGGAMTVNATLALATLGSAGSTSLCRNASNQISTCSSSLRYKTNVHPFIGGLSVLNRLRPITFDWKQGGMHDLGFGAEDIATVEPLLVTHNDQGEVEGVKYDRITAVLVNAVKEQQQQIQQQQAQITQQQNQIASLKRVVCSSHPRALVCK